MTNSAYRDNYDLIDWTQPVGLGRRERVASTRSDLAAPSVISDVMKPVQSMLDGKMYDSKSALRATYKAAGVTEVGNDSSVTGKPKFMGKRKACRKDVRGAVDRAFSRAGLGA